MPFEEYDITSFARPFMPDILHLRDAQSPSVGNYDVKIHRFRYTCTLVEEPVEVLQQRLQTLWENSTNSKDHDPLKNWAKKLKYELRGPRGAAVK